jgi:hypothetical protein
MRSEHQQRLEMAQFRFQRSLERFATCRHPGLKKLLGRRLVEANQELIKAERRRFTVQVQVSDQWIPLEDAQYLPQDEAHVRAAYEASIVGQHRVRYVPVYR